MSKNNSAPRVVMDELVYQKIMYWVNKTNLEISGLGNVVVEAGNVLRVVDVMLCEQKNTHTTTELDPAAVRKAAYELHLANAPGEMRFWWHSHANMGVFWSGQDLETINALAEGGWFVSTVFNKKRETKTAISMAEPFRMLYDDVTFDVERVLPADVVASWDKEYVAKVESLIPKLPAGTGMGGKKSYPNQYPRQNYNGNQNPHFDRNQKHNKPNRPHRDVYPPLSKEEQAEIAALASMMTDEDPDLGSYYTNDQDDRSYGDLDWPGHQPSRRSGGELSKPMRSVSDAISERNRIEDKIGKYEDRILTLDAKGKQPPESLLHALAEAENDLQDIEEELDTLQDAGLITEDERFEARPVN